MLDITKLKTEKKKAVRKRKSKFTTKNTEPIKVLPLKRVYFDKFSYKILLRPPPDPKLTGMYNVKHKNTVIKERNEFVKIRKELNSAHCNKTNYNYWVDSWADIRSHYYWNRLSLYFDDEARFNRYIEKLKDWVVEIEKPLNDKHVEIYNNAYEIIVETRDRLYVYDSYRYKIIISLTSRHVNSFNSLTKCFLNMNEIFCDRTDVYLRLNDYTITMHTNNEDDLMFIKLSNPGKIKIYKAVLPREILELTK